jgi:uncharacterized membrane protein YbhN (UPF0104 family)
VVEDHDEGHHGLTATCLGSQPAAAKEQLTGNFQANLSFSDGLFGHARIMTALLGVPHRRSAQVVVAGCVAGLLALLLEAVVTGFPDTVRDTSTALTWLARPFTSVSLPVAGVLVGVAAMHHLAAAAAARAAAGVPMPRGELVMAQFAASAANRVTPAGLGGATVIGRYFVRRAGLSTPRSAAAVSALALLGGVADLVAFAALVAIGVLTGATGMGGELTTLGRRAASLVPSSPVWPWIVGGTLAAASVAGLLLRRRAASVLHRLLGNVRQFVTQLASLVRHPLRLLWLVSASATTTLLLAAGFASAAVLTPGGLPASTFGAVMIGYMVGAAAGNALPTPGGIGSTDAALVAVLVAGGLPVATAIPVVFAFRLLTFWATALVGVFVARPLRRRGAL